MAITTRQSSLLVAEDWTRLYQTFRNADFQSYDYETLRKSMIDYLRLYYPEDFNDYIESSEFIALIDLVAFLGQSLAFRGDLNARENFIDTAQRRDSVLKLARLISYNPKRNICASGLLKIDSVSTTENIYDSNGLNLAGLVINWADTANDNWYEQFTTIINASLNSNQAVGKPSNSQILNGVTTEEYQVNFVPNLVGTYSFSTVLEGVNTEFEMVSPTSARESYIYEVDPRPNNSFNLLYRNDGLGNSSNNTGFFTYFKQGVLKSFDLDFQESIPNRVYSVNANNINNTDIWLYSLDQDGNFDKLWTQVPAVGITNVVYNKGTNKNVYQVNTRAGDQIDLVFGDGSFANIPQGRYKLFYRVSNGLSYKITPAEMRGIVIPLNYVSRGGRTETITIRASLRYTVTNATARETVDEIRQKAPQQYYTQDRMVTGEDYNILPYTLFNSVLKVKAVNRTSSGVSRFLDVIDTTGKYSSTNIFCQDGVLYRNPTEKTFSFSFNTTNDIFRIVTNQVKPLATGKEMLQYFYGSYNQPEVLDTYWNQSPDETKLTGWFYDSTGKIVQVGDFVADSKQYFKQNAIVKFSAGEGNCFDSRNQIKAGQPTNPGDKYFIYAQFIQILADGTNGGLGDLANGSGPITVNQSVPTGAVAVQVFPVFNNDFSTSLVNTIVAYVQAYEDFGLRYDVDDSQWKIILPQDLDAVSEFDLGYAGETSGSGLDSSWLIRFQTVGLTYTVYYRGLEYVFESVKETNFYFDERTKIFDPKTGLTIKDQIKVLKVNSVPDGTTPLALDYQWDIYKNIVEVDGYRNPNKILVTFPDINDDGVPDNPELFELIVSPNTNIADKYVYFQATYGYDNFVVQEPVSNSLIVSQYATKRDADISATLYQNGQLFYITDEGKFYQLVITGATYNLIEVSGYTAKIGREGLYFQYRHNAPNNRRIDPSPNNIIDLYILTKSYAEDFTSWVQDTTGKLSEPTAPNPETLANDYSQLDNYKSISDTIIYNPARFKPIFGSKAEANLQANFKVVKNPNVVVSDNDVKTSVIAAINEYFNIDNWDFGETFYFSELSAYLHQALAPNIASITIVPASADLSFGSLLQVNAEFNEIIVSAATVDNVQIIPAITAAQINQVVIA